ncbi:hypothetical protein SADUNF_Sadunf18G0000400 [Salix dunnii]|uniref:DNA-directed RNA polymerase III subunit RPC6 n=1 Tax=Salix dunnii TaxID=1413687 RepID=A0A835J326_9ROSI|nr:hypothetical protein SADUNF_Sadunf18G0000400 [Salix dunnii]
MNDLVVEETKCAPIILIFPDILLTCVTLRKRDEARPEPITFTTIKKIPLILRPSNYLVTSSDLKKWHGWANDLASSIGSSFVESDNGPNSTLLCEELNWLLEDSLENRSSSSCLSVSKYKYGTSGKNENVIIQISQRQNSSLISNNEKLGQGLLADVGISSGAIAIGMGLQDVIEVKQESWFEPLNDVEGQIVGIVSNPPYIPSDNISGLHAEDGRHEPRFVLDGGASGMDYLLHLCNVVVAVLKPGMSRLQGPSSLKRKQPEVNSPAQSLTKIECLLYDVIRNKQDIGIWTRDMKKEVKLTDNLETFYGTEFEPSKEISGGAWYLEGSLDKEFIESLKQLCKRQIERRGIATLEEVTDSINSYPAFNVDVTKQQNEEILRNLILDNVIMEVKSNGMGEFASIPFGGVCYKYISKVGLGGEPKAGALASIPCGVCPRITQCTPDGIISPKTCVYYQKWLDF